MPKAKWTPDSDELARELDELVGLHQQVEKATTAYKEKLAKLAQPTGGPVPVTYLADLLHVVRKTIYRHLGKSMT